MAVRCILRHTRRELRHQTIIESRPVPILRLERIRGPYFRIRGELHLSRHHADNLVTPVLDEESPAQRVGGFTEVALCESEADDCGLLRILCREWSARSRRQAENAEEIGMYQLRPNKFRVI